MTEAFPRGFSLAVNTALILLGAILAIAAVDSIGWPYVHDSPLMLYAGWHLSQGGAPYRDLFDMNMPGTYFVMWALGSVFGWDDFGFRLFDLLCLAVMGAGTWMWLRRFGRAGAAAASLLFPLWYLAQGPSTSLQREFLALVPLTVAFGLGESDRPALVRAAGIGLLIGAAALVKPHAMLLALPAVARQVLIARRDDRWRVTGVVAAGLAVPLIASGTYLASRGSLDEFLEVATNYWPLYTQLSGTHQVIRGVERYRYLAESTAEGLMHPLTFLGLAGAFAILNVRRQRGLGWMFIGLVVSAAVYPALAGQFWTYHWLPFQYAVLSAAALALPDWPPRRWTPGQVARATVGGIALIGVGAVAVGALLASYRQDPASDVVRSRARVAGVPREVGEFLQAHLRPGDVVQPLDWTGGAVHGMLRARARLATRFMYDFHFYHHVDTPYTRRLRRQFVRQLADARPRFVIEVFAGRPWPGGPGTSRDFPALEEFLAAEYRVVQSGATYNILERRPPGVAGGQISIFGGMAVGSLRHTEPADE